MRILCCLDGTNIEALEQAVTRVLIPSELVIGLIYVIDSGPRGDMERTRERLLRPLHLPPSREEQLSQVETDAARDILQEGQHYFPQAETLQRTGRPEREIVQCAIDWHATSLCYAHALPDTRDHRWVPNQSVTSRDSCSIMHHARCYLYARSREKHNSRPLHHIENPDRCHLLRQRVNYESLHV